MHDLTFLYCTLFIAIEAVTRYIVNFKRIYKCLEKGLSVNDTVFAINVSKNLVIEYINLMEDLKEKKIKI